MPRISPFSDSEGIREISEYLQGVYEFSNGLLDMLDGDPGSSMIQIHATLDDVGSCGNDGMRAVVGYVAYSETWRKFNGRWLFTLPQLQKQSLHTARDLRAFPLIGGMDDEAACLVLAPFIAAVKETLLGNGAVPICIVTDCEAYEQLDEKEKQFVRPPQEHSFEIAVMHSVRALMTPLQDEDAVSVQMDESSDVPQLYRVYERLKTTIPDMKQHLGAVCFLDDKRHPPLQAADMLGNALIKTWRRFKAKEQMPRLMRELTFAGDSSRLQLLHFDTPTLKALAQMRMRTGNKVALS